MTRVEGMRPVHWSAEQARDTTAAGRASLRKRFQGIDEQIGRVVGQMADWELEREKDGKPAPWRVFTDIRPIVPAGLSIAIGWTVHVIAHGPAIEALTGARELRMPVIPDEHNPRPGKTIQADDKPFEFSNMVAAERAAEQAISAMHNELARVSRSVGDQPQQGMEKAA